MVEVRTYTYKCPFCGREFRWYSKEYDKIVLECEKTGRLYITTAMFSAHPYTYLEKYISDNYKIPHEKTDYLKIYELLKKLIKKNQCEGNMLILGSPSVCPYCNKFTKDVKLVREEIIEINAAQSLEFIPLRSVDDLPTKELKEIFKDFDFKSWTAEERNDKKNQEDWKKLHGAK